MQRILLFVATNLAIVISLSLVASLLGFGVRADAGGLDLGALLGLALVFGSGGSFLSLLMSRWVATTATGARVIERPQTSEEVWLVNCVRRLARDAGIGAPAVAVYPAPEMNAFATGARRDAALVAVSSGLLRGMSRDEVEAVLAHEVSHIANGDMVTLALLQGVLNTFVIFLARLAGWVVDQALSGQAAEGEGNEVTPRAPGPAYFITHLLLELLLGLLASLVVLWFSRRREFRADAGAARLTSAASMIGALRRLQGQYDHSQLPERVSAFGIATDWRPCLPVTRRWNSALQRCNSRQLTVERLSVARQEQRGARC